MSEKKGLDGGCLLHHAHHVVFAHDQQFLAVHFDGGAGVFAEENALADFDIERPLFAVVLNFAFADGEDFALVGFFSGVVGDDDAACDVLRSSSSRRTSSRSCRGRILIFFIVLLLSPCKKNEVVRRPPAELAAGTLARRVPAP